MQSNDVANDKKVGLRWLLRFRKLDMTQPEQRQALVDTFVNSIYLYDDKVLITSYNKIVVFIDRSPAECYNKFRMLWIGMYHLPQRRFSGGSNHSFFVEMLIS